MSHRPGALSLVVVAIGASCAAPRAFAQDAVANADMAEVELGPNTGAQPKDRSASEAQDPGGAGAPEKDARRWHATLGVDVTTAYYWRGYLCEDSGLIAQPYADLALDVWRGEDATVSLLLGTWHSIHGMATDAGVSGSSRYWYEADFYAGAALVLGDVTVEARYSVYTSPSDAWDALREVSLSLAYDDSEPLGAWALSPTVLLGVETGPASIDGGRNGVFLQLGVSPGFSFDLGPLKEVEMTFPAAVGLSLSNYFEGDGSNDAFGFASLGAAVDVPLNVPESWGSWTLSAGVQVLLLGDVLADVNDGDEAEVIGTAGVSVEF